MDSNILYVFLLFNQYFSLINSQCPPDSILAPCSCISEVLPQTSAPFNILSQPTNITQYPSITCAHIHNASFDLQFLFAKLSSVINSTFHSKFHTFLLRNTTIRSLPANVFVNITFENLLFENNFQLTSIDRNAFSYFQTAIQSFQTLNSNLSDSESIFSMLKQFSNLRFLSMQNDRLKFIPSHAFNHTNLTNIYFGLEYRNQTQPLESIGDYAFYNLPNLRFLRIFSPNLSRINKYAFAQRKRSAFATDPLTNMLELYLGGPLIDSTSFQSTSLTRFRNRFVFLRLYNTSITYLDENIFQPFLEANPSSLLGIDHSNTLLECHCRSAWIQKDYFNTTEQMENRVYGYAHCWEYDFTKNC